MKEFPIIEAEKIILRKLESKDFFNYLDYVNNEDISNQFNFKYTIESAENRFNEIINKYNEETKPFIWVITIKETDELAGMITVDKISLSNKSFSIAYGLREKFRGNNYAYQACYCLITYIFNNFDMHRLELAHNIDNIASQKIIEKLGARFEGVARESKFYNGKFKDRKVYSIIKNEWDLYKNEK